MQKTNSDKDHIMQVDGEHTVKSWTAMDIQRDAPDVKAPRHSVIMRTMLTFQSLLHSSKGLVKWPSQQREQKSSCSATAQVGICNADILSQNIENLWTARGIERAHVEDRRTTTSLSHGGHTQGTCQSHHTSL